ncbi:50S ribosomal protein L25/general stress protein Ctc [Cytophagaceae bacterium ABcell3]|nr:50S ribosomal protein L25/general stress protein Ctc [Cytophagaceae bacterium ABcell3]
MKTVEIIGYKRANLGKKVSKDLRAEAQVPCVLYGGKDQVHFHVPTFLFRDIVYTPDSPKILINVDGKQYETILQEVQFHPVSENILHADFLELVPTKLVKVDVPVKFTGTSPGVVKGGKFTVNLKKIKIKAYPKNIPESISVDISKLELGKSIKVSAITPGDYTILNNKSLPVATVEVPRALKGQQAQAAE